MILNSGQKISRKLCGKTVISSIPTLKENGGAVENPQLKAQIINDYFSQTQLNDNNTELPHLENFTSDKRISIISVICGSIISFAKHKCVKGMWS